MSDQPKLDKGRQAVPGSTRAPAAQADVKLSPGQRVVIPVVREDATVAKQQIETGRVVVHVTPQERREVIDVPLDEEHVEVERIAVNRPVERPEPAREEGDLTIVPVYEEIVVIEKRLMLKEEIRIRRRRSTRTERREVTLKHEEARVLRSDAPAGNLPKSPPEA